MKRSEMLEQLEILIHNTSNIYVPSSYSYDAKSLAIEILDSLEEKGMLPPYTGKYDRLTTRAYGNHEWEPEDDK